jgi:hypothetical protein
VIHEAHGMGEVGRPWEERECGWNRNRRRKSDLFLGHSAAREDLENRHPTTTRSPFFPPSLQLQSLKQSTGSASSSTTAPPPPSSLLEKMQKIAQEAEERERLFHISRMGGGGGEEDEEEEEEEGMEESVGEDAYTVSEEEVSFEGRHSRKMSASGRRGGGGGRREMVHVQTQTGEEGEGAGGLSVASRRFQ